MRVHLLSAGVAEMIDDNDDDLTELFNTIRILMLWE